MYYEPRHNQCVYRRRFIECDVFCDNVGSEGPVTTCDACGTYRLTCCDHPWEDCHNYCVVYTDGSCLGNGYSGSASGIGLTFSPYSYSEYSIPVTDNVDGGPRTNQRAELLAAIQGVRVCNMNDCCEKKCLVVATDSAYVVRGITEWFPKWRVSVVF